MTNKKGLVSLMFLMLVMSMISFVSAEIFISQPESIYNLGDEFNVELEVDKFQEGYFDVNLICSEGETENLFHGVLTAKIIQITRQLTEVYIGNLMGSCYIEAKYLEETKTGESFKISNEIEVDLELKEMSIMAGEKVVIKGKASKENGEAINGFINVRVGEEIKVSGLVQNGIFDLDYIIKQDAISGSYNLEAEVYDEDNNDQVLNTGIDSANLMIKQEPAWIDIAIDKQVVNPNQNITIIPFLYDRANSEIPGELVLMIVSDNGIEFEKILIGSQEFIYLIKSNHPVGYSKIIVLNENLSAEKIIDVQEYEKIIVEIVNNTVIIKNIGNVAYSGPIEVTIGEKSIVKNIKIGLGESKVYELSAPDGEYSLTISGEDDMLHQGSVVLTGDAISINEIGRQAGIFLMYPLVWIFILLIIGGVIYVMYMNNKKKKSFSYPVEIVNVKKSSFQKDLGESEEKIKGKNEEQRKKEAKPFGNVIEEHKNIIKPGAITKAEHVLVLNGQRQDVGLIDIKIRGDLGKVGKETINNALKEVYEEKGIISQMENDFIIIFSPSMTRTTKNTDVAVKVAQKIQKILAEHNGKFREKINYGIGINSGEIIARKEKDKFKFTSVKNTLNLTKKVADIADKELLISKDAHDRSRTNVKVEKSPKSSETLELFSVQRVIDTAKNKEFIQRFLRKN